MSSGSYEVLPACVIPVFKRLRSIFQKPEDTAPKAIALGDIPLFLEERERAMDTELHEMMAPHRDIILGASERIKGILDLMGSKERDAAWHPKLEKIGKTALPNFIRSMHQALDRSLPPAPSMEFYKEAANVLKSCIGAMKGAGKYLPMIFPDEMKALRHEIRIFGQAINTITAEITAREQERSIIQQLRKEYSAFTTEQSRLNEIRIKYERVKEQCGDTERRIDTLRKNIEEIKSGADFRALGGYREQLSILEREAREVHLKNEGVLGVILTIHRRAEKVAHRTNDSGWAIIEETIRVLGSTTSTCDQLGEVLERSLPVIMRFIEAGDLPLKGQEESRIFGPGSIPLHEALQACKEMTSIDQKVTETKDRHTALPLLREIQHLEQEIIASEEMRNKYQKESHQIADQLDAIPNSLQAHHKNVSRMLTEISRGEWQLLEEREDREKG